MMAASPVGGHGLKGWTVTLAAADKVPQAAWDLCQFKEKSGSPLILRVASREDLVSLHR
jgi:hypothetical protein